MRTIALCVYLMGSISIRAQDELLLSFHTMHTYNDPVAERTSMINHHKQTNVLKKRATLENCLMSCYRIDPRNAVLIMAWLEPLLADETYHSIIDTFIEKAKKLNIQFENSLSSELLPDDAVLKASQWHTVLFENAYIRILRGVVKCGECVPPHTHQWNGLMLVIQGALFKTEYFQGAVEIEDFPIGVYEKHAETNLSAPSTNIGSFTFESLLFEVKKTG